MSSFSERASNFFHIALTLVVWGMTLAASVHVLAQLV